VGDQFEILRKLGEGGYGAVYEAADRALRRKVAIKMMLATRAVSKEYVDKFLREARTAAQLIHPNTVAIHQVGCDKGANTHYLAMEFVEGRTLHDILQEKGPMPLEQAVEILAQCCRGLAAAHKKNIIHRDIKPGNIMITPSGGVKIADFGLAKVFDQQQQQASMVIGTPYFMPPEQFEGKAKDGRTDIYALGVTFYYMLTLKRPFQGSSPAQILVSIMTKEPTPVNEMRQDLPPKVWEVIRKMIHRDLDKRYHECGEVLEDLEALRSPDEGEKVYCPDCGLPNPAEAPSCKGCGASLRERCPVCGTEEALGVKFCGDCGANIPLEREVKTLADEGRALLAEGHLNRGLEKLQLARDRSPENAEVASLLREAEGRRDAREGERTAISALLAAGDLDKAEQRIKSGRALYPDDVSILELEGDLQRARVVSRSGLGTTTVEALLKARRYPEAREAAERLMMSEGRSRDLVLLLEKAEAAIKLVEEKAKRARDLDQSGAGREALAAWREVLELSPDHRDAVQAVEQIERSVGEVDATLGAALKLLEEGDPDGALSRLFEAASRAGDDPRVSKAMDDARARAGQLQEAAAKVREHIAAGRMPEAEKAREALARKFPGSPEVPALADEVRKARMTGERRGKARVVEEHVAARRWTEARDAAAAFLSDEGEEFGVPALAGRAKEALARVAALVAGGGVAEQAGRFEEAAKAYKGGVEEEPGNAAAKEGLERASARVEKVRGLRAAAAEACKGNDPARAVERLKELLALSPGDEDARKEMRLLEEQASGRARGVREVEELLASGETEDALKKARKLEEAYPGDAEAREVASIAKRLGEARDSILARAEKLLATEGREREAGKVAQVALRMFPGDSKAAALLAKARSHGPITG